MTGLGDARRTPFPTRSARFAPPTGGSPKSPAWPSNRRPRWPPTLDGKPLAQEAQKLYDERRRTPACVKACPSGCLQFGGRAALLAEARRRIAAAPKKYVPRVYGEKELGGLSWLYLAAVPFEKLGLPIAFPPPGQPQPVGRTRPFGRACEVAATAAGGLLAAACWFFRRRDDVRRSGDF